MRFLPTDEQVALAEAIDDIVTSNDGTAVVRAWRTGESQPARTMWRQLADLGLMGICVSEADGGVGGSAVDLVIAFERLGFHGVPGPYIESIALLPDLVDQETRASIIDGTVIATASVAGLVPLAVDASSSSLSFVVGNDSITNAVVDGEEIESLDGSRRLARLIASDDPVGLDPAAIALAVDRASLACAAMLLGVGERLLSEAVSYAKVREQFGRPIGEYQAIKHKLADVRIALTFARPLVHAAGLDLGTATGARTVSAAKVAAGDAANLAARASLQVHGAIGFTDEHDLGVWITRARALAGSWGTPAYHRARIARLLLTPEG